MRRHRKCPLIPELTVLRERSDIQLDTISTLRKKLTGAHADLAWLANERSSDVAEIHRLASDLADAEATVVRLTDDSAPHIQQLADATRAAQQAKSELATLKAWSDRAGQERIALDAKLATEKDRADKALAENLSLRVDLADARETDADGRKIAEFRARAELAETTAKRDRGDLLDLQKRVEVIGEEIRAEWAELVAKLEREIAQRDRAVRLAEQPEMAGVPLTRSARDKIGGAW